jgi:SAM-dependent MidA family methyltransferase
VNELEAILVARIKERGPMPFASYMQMALYHPAHGYYSSGPRTGFAGHFVTAAEIGPAFGALWARGFAQIWDACGRPERFDLVEIGAG